MKGVGMSEIAKTLSCCALLMTLGLSCSGRGAPEPGHARKVQLFNCNHDSEAVPTPSYNICTRVDGGEWVSRGPLNSVLGDWANPICTENEQHQILSITLNLLDTPGKWEIRAIKVPIGDEFPCDSTCPPPPGPTACTNTTRFFQADVQASEEPIKVELKEPGQ